MIYLYTENHPNKTGILDFSIILKSLFHKYNLKLDNTNEELSKNYVFIDEFSDFFEILSLKKKKEKRKLTYILFSTEFETQNGNGKSFNQFKETNFLEAHIIDLIAILCFFVPKKLRTFSFLGKFSALIILPLVFFKIFYLEKINYNTLINEIREFKRRVYMKVRRKGFDLFSNQVDLLIKIHPLLNDNKNDLVIYPPISDYKTPKNQKIKISGTQTNYRIKQCSEFKLKIKNKKLNYDFKFNSTISFNTEPQREIFGFSYQPAQTSIWDKSNPVKIWRDFVLHDAIPIVDIKFNDHPIENIAITCDEFLDQKFNNNQLLNAQKKYNKVSDQLNKTVFDSIKESLRE